MNRLPVYPKFDRGIAYNGETYENWRPTDQQRKLVEWLRENVGPVISSSFKFPMRGEGWLFYHGFSEDIDPDDYAWRHFNSCSYKPKGYLGHFLQIDDPVLAVMCKLQGYLDVDATQVERWVKPFAPKGE